ncbi:MAG: Ig domain-containing protein [Clostridia bacterium]|nr:Ig domain-containing protein [Clostridia bacterium]
MKLTEKKLNVKSIILITLILPVLVIGLSSAAIIITARSVQPQDTLDMKLLTKSEQILPETNEEALSVLDSSLSLSARSGILRYEKITAAEITEIVSSNASLQKVLSFMKGSFTSDMTSDSEDITVKYGEDTSTLTSILPGSTPDSFTSSFSEDILNATLCYEKAFSNMFFTKEDTDAIKLFIKENETVFSAINEKLTPGEVKFIFSADTKNEHILSLELQRSYTYSAHIAFKNTLSSIGSSEISIVFTFKDSYSFSYAGIDIGEDIMTLSEDGYDTLTVTPFVESDIGNDEFSLTFISSDESIATVDENGQVTAIRESTAPVKITIVLDYLGRKFSDSCLVYVVTPVEKVTLSETEITLKAGESHSLNATAGPDDATIKAVNFITDDESILTASKSGEIKALKPGTAKVYAYSEQGLICSYCTVTVTE